jgi:hypothetical protein
LIERNAAARLGLVRAWYAQVGAPRATGTIAHLSYDHGILLAQSTRGLITAIEAETGRTLWSTQAGPPDHMCTEAHANAEFVAVVNGSVLYVLDRAHGNIVWQKQLGGAPGAGPGVTATHAFVPMVSGRVEGYDLAKGAKQTPWIYKSAGRILVPPLATAESVSWTTEKGYFYVADPSGDGIRYRLETRDAIHAQPAYWTPNMYAGSTDGYIYAVNAERGQIAWKYALGDAVYSPPVAIQGKLFVVSQLGGLHCLDTTRGELLWTAPGVTQFMALSPSRIYASDRMGRLAVLSAATGTRMGAMPLSGISQKLANTQSDRIFLATDNCVVQCLRETALKTPVAYLAPPPEKAEVKRGTAAPKEEAAEEPSEQPAEQTPAAEEPGEEMPAEEMPAETDPPAEAPADEDSPFK